MADERTANERTAEERTANERTANSNAVPCRGLPAQVPPPLGRGWGWASPWGGAGGGLHMKKVGLSLPPHFSKPIATAKEMQYLCSVEREASPPTLSKGEARVVTGKALSE